jgi:hypothetical protein
MERMGMSEAPGEREIVWLAEVETEHDPKTEHGARGFVAKTREGLLIEVRKFVENHLRAKGQEMPPQLDAHLTAGKDYDSLRSNSKSATPASVRCSTERRPSPDCPA